VSNFKEKQKQKQKKVLPELYQKSIVLFARFSGWIVGPVIVAVVTGKMVDNRYDSEPMFVLIFIGVAFVISMIGIVREALAEYKKIC
jgi:F0F1-type ATP synthase assembly protein I